VSGSGEIERTTGSRPRDARGDRLFLAVTAAVLVVALSFNALNVGHEWARNGRPLEAWEPFLWEGSSGLVLLSLAPLILALTRRVWPIDPPLVPKLSIHLLAAIGVSLVHVVAIGAIRASVYAAAGRHYDPLGPLGDWPYELRKDLLIYAGLVAIYVAWRQLRDRGDEAGEAGAQVLEVRDGARRHFVPLTEVVWVEAAGNYVELHRGGAGLLHRASLSEMERQLRSAGFVRIHRSRLVRREAIEAIESKPTGDFVVRLRGGRELAGSRRYRRPLLAD
jgi:hypothetical protein